MKRKAKLFVIILILFPALVIECDNENQDNNCSTALCTTELRSIVLMLKHKADSSLFHLTDYKVTRVSDNLDITPKHDNISDYSGYYSLANDSDIDLFRFNNTEVEFTGYVNNSIIIQTRFIVTADCCHISLVEGKTGFYL